MNNFQKLKNKIIKSETEWRSVVHPESDNEAQMYIQGMIDEINDCKDIDDLAVFYINSGYSPEESHKIMIDLLLEDQAYTIYNHIFNS